MEDGTDGFSAAEPAEQVATRKEDAATSRQLSDFDVDIATESGAEEELATSGPMARPRGRRLLFGGLTSGPSGPAPTAPSGPAPAAFSESTCYCQKFEYPVPTGYD